MTIENMKTINGNLLDLAEQGEFDIILHGCNCFCVMGGGIAKQIKDKYPSAYLADLGTAKGDYNKLGTYSLAPSNQDPKKFKFGIANCYTQFNYSSGEDVFEYTAFELILQKLTHSFPSAKFGLPLIGCGLAGGDETRIRSMIITFADTISKSGGSCTLVEFKP